MKSPMALLVSGYLVAAVCEKNFPLNVVDRHLDEETFELTLTLASGTKLVIKVEDVSVSERKIRLRS
jgi:hypothetical protein